MILDIVPTKSSPDNSWHIYAAKYNILADIMITGEAKERFFSFRQFIQFLRDLDTPILLQGSGEGEGLRFGNNRVGFQSVEKLNEFWEMFKLIERQFFEFTFSNYDHESEWRIGVENWVDDMEKDGAINLRDPYAKNTFLIHREGTMKIRFLESSHAVLFMLNFKQISRNTTW